MMFKVIVLDKLYSRRKGARKEVNYVAAAAQK